MCFKDNFTQKDENALAVIDPNLHGLYYLAKATMQNYKGRKIVTWGDEPNFKAILKGKTTVFCGNSGQPIR